MGGSILFACQDWANTKAAYRFFANGRLEEAESSAVTSSSRALRWF
ncbi:transposase [Bradyrhizobium sp. 197]|nr:transposase [Bradyrhizobium sp. 197]